MAENVELPEGFVQTVREKLIEEYGKLGEETVNLLDDKEYQRFLSDDYYFARHIKRKKGDLEATIPFLIDVLKWRKKEGLSQLTETSFPKEFYEFGGIHVYGKDKDGNVICHIRLRLFSKIPEILDILKKFVLFQMLRADAESAEIASQTGKDVGWVLLFDCTAAGVANADLEMSNFVNNTLKNYFPYGQKYVLNHNLPWLLNALKNVVIAMLPSNVKKRIKFSNDKTIREFIADEQLPTYMGGTNNYPYPYIPQGAITTSEMVQKQILKLSSEEELRVQKYYEKVYNELKNSKHSEKA
jgi:hypothetical protein